MDVSSNYYYSSHVTKQDYDRAFENARKESLECPDLSPTQIARIYHVKEDSLRKTVLRIKRKERNANGLYNRHGGNNKILSEAQEEAIRQYCYEHWEAGLGATHQMVYAAICHLKDVRSSLYSIIYLTFIGSITSSTSSFQKLVCKMDT